MDPDIEPEPVEGLLRSLEREVLSSSMSPPTKYGRPQLANET